MSWQLPAASSRAPSPASSLALPGAIFTAAATIIVAALIAGVGLSRSLPAADLAGDGASAPSPAGSADIPPRYLALYRAAARRYGLDWSVLAAIGKVECDHGRDPDPSCSVAGAVNPAGAGGPMQFLASTWQQYGVDGDGDGLRNRWDPADAIFAAANYLRASGAPHDYARAIFAYNHASWYVADVERWATRYRGPSQGAPAADGPGAIASGEELARMQGATSTLVTLTEGGVARLAPDNGHLALIPVGVPVTVQAMLIAGNELQDLPYGPGGHPDPLGAPEEDCSSTINYILYRAGIRSLDEIVHDNPLAQDYVTWGAPGPGRWVTIYATDRPTPHVFATIAGLRIDTSHAGTDAGPNREQDGPRWRLFDRIPSWAHWSIRHPPGL